MILDLDHGDALDPARSGAKAAWLARARRAGLPVLPGLVVEAGSSRGHMQLAASALESGGSGRARLAIMEEPVPDANVLVASAQRLGQRLVARSSTPLEESGAWSGAFASYVDIGPEEVPRAVAGCWASAFTVSALERQRAAGVSPGSFPMAVLVQPALDPVAGGTAHIDQDGTVTVTGVKGSPAPLLQGWVGGAVARRDRAWQGDELAELLGLDVLDEIGRRLEAASVSLGVSSCEWALDQRVWLLQVGTGEEGRKAEPPGIEHVAPELAAVARAAALAPGRLGDELIMPWAIGGLPPGPFPPTPLERGAALELRDRLLSQVWGLPPGAAMDAARTTIGELLGPSPDTAVGRLASLNRPDPEAARRLVGHVRSSLRPNHATRHGIGRWEPFVAAVALSMGARHTGTSASGGVGAGARSEIDRPEGVDGYLARSVITAPQPVPNLAPLLWDASGLATTTGSPGAHLFESARALGVPAVCGVDLPAGEQIVAIDGWSGVVATLPFDGDDDE